MFLSIRELNLSSIFKVRTVLLTHHGTRMVGWIWNLQHTMLEKPGTPRNTLQHCPRLGCDRGIWVGLFQCSLPLSLAAHTLWKGDQIRRSSVILLLFAQLHPVQWILLCILWCLSQQPASSGASSSHHTFFCISESKSPSTLMEINGFKSIVGEMSFNLPHLQHLSSSCCQDQILFCI